MPESIFMQPELCIPALVAADNPIYAPRMSESPVHQNVRKLRTHLGMKQAAFADEVGTEQANVSKWEKNVMPGTTPLMRMAELAGVSAAAFVDEEWRPGVRAPVQAWNGPPSDSRELVPIHKLDLSLSMGPGTLIDDYVEAEPVTFDLAFIRAITRSPSDRLRLVTGIGDSMYPTLNWGDTILIDTTDRALAKQDGIYWINLYGAAGIKRLRTVGPGRVLVKSDNPTVGDQEVSAEDLRIEGRAIWAARGL